METLAWDTLARHLVGAAPVTVGMGGTRGVVLTYCPLTPALTLRIPAGADEHVPLKPLEELRVELMPGVDGRVLVVSTSEVNVFRELHRFATLLTEDFESTGRSACEAFASALERWRSFAAVRAPMTTEQQIGLLGELIVLRSLTSKDGPVAVDAWTARTALRAGRHDFALKDLDLEVKTTRGNVREHIVHGLDQLAPAGERALFILSIRLEDGGAASGTNLPECIEALRDLLPVGSSQRQHFESQLRASGYQPDDDPLYLRRLRLADGARLIPVDDSCPRLIRPLVECGLGAALAGRVSQVTYRVNLDGLGFEEGSTPFTRALGFSRLLVS